MPTTRDPISGRVRQVSATAHTKREAEELLSRMLSEVHGGQHGGPDVSMGELFERWYELASPDWSPKTALETRRYLNNYLIPHLGKVKVRKVTTASLDGLYTKLRKSGGRKGAPLSPSSVRRIHVAVRGALTQAKRWGWIVHNPAADASPGKLKAAEITPPDAAAVAKLIRAAGAEESEFGIFLRMAATTGARRAELCALRWSDIDMAKGSLVIRRAMVEHPGGGFLVKDTKTHASRRIAIDPVMVKALASHRVRMAARGLAAGTPLGKHAYVFSYALDCADPWRPDVVTRRFVRLRDRLGLEDVRLHDLRHFVATRMLADGVAVPTVSGCLGHASSATTLNVYAHFLAASDRDAA
ncbi:MAG: site-specific integrase, partial [Acidimicrobiales bacterium]